MKRSEAVIVVKDAVTTTFLTMFDPEIGIDHTATNADTGEEGNILDVIGGHEPIMEVAELFANLAIAALENAGLIFEEG